MRGRTLELEGFFILGLDGYSVPVQVLLNAACISSGCSIKLALRFLLLRRSIEAVKSDEEGV